MHQVTLEEAKDQLSQLVQQASNGEEIIITRDSAPVAKLGPIAEAKPRRKLGTAAGLVHMADDFDAPLEDFAEYM